MIRTYFLALTIAAALTTPSLAVAEKYPETTADGLVLQDQSDLGAVYTRPGATLQAYDKVMLVEAYVAFKKDWQSHYNRTRNGLGENVTDEDVENIKTAIVGEFSKVFTEVLTDGGYVLTDEVGADVLIFRPAIINLEVTAPDLRKPGMHATIASSAGFLTLYVELYDSVSNEKIAEVFDNEEAGNRGFGYRTNRSTNKQALDQTLRHWAELLVRRLDEAHGKSE